jgi:two-component system, cell cycle sensor histidine kinase and response regulator CckA
VYLVVRRAARYGVHPASRTVPYNETQVTLVRTATRRRLSAPLRTSLLYAAFGTAWIILGDFELFRAAGLQSSVWLVSVGKGLLFVAGSALFIYFMVRRDVRAERDTVLVEQRAQELEAVGRVAASIAHEFNNILTAVVGHVALLRETTAEDDPQREHTEQVHAAATRAATLTRHLLVLSGKNVARPSHIDPGSLIRALAPVLQRTVGTDVRVDIELDSDLWGVRGDPAEVQQVLMTLVLNARDAMPGRGRLRIRARNMAVDEPDLKGDFVQLYVTDTGVGMSADTLARLFEPFFTTKEQSSGLGLATARGVVRQAGGRIRASSRPRHGTTVEILWPRADEEDVNAPAPAPSAPAVARWTVLLAEDDDAVRELTARLLQRNGHRVVAAADGEEALAALTGVDHIDILVADIVMPGMSGVELGCRVRDLVPGLPILFTSGYAGGVFTEESDLPPGSAFLEKPYEPGQLLASMGELLNNGR